MNIFYFIIDLMKQIPNVVWSGIMASLITLSGIFLSNRNTRKQQLEALKHDATQRDREREMSLRRDVYLAAAEAIVNGQHILARFPNLNISDEDFSTEFQQNNASIAKVQVVGTNPTVQAVFAYSNEFSRTFLELSLKRLKLIERKYEIESISRMIDKLLTEGEGYLELMKQHRLEGNTDNQKWKILFENLELIQKQRENFFGKKQDLETIQRKEQICFTKNCTEKLFSISQFIPPAVLSVRDELDLPLDKDVYLEYFKKKKKKGRVALDSFFSEIEQMLDAPK